MFGPTGGHVTLTSPELGAMFLFDTGLLLLAGILRRRLRQSQLAPFDC
jgi:hypothetical protein